MSFNDFVDKIKSYQVLFSLSKTIVVIHTSIRVILLGYTYNYMSSYRCVKQTIIRVFILEYTYTYMSSVILI